MPEALRILVAVSNTSLSGRILELLPAAGFAPEAATPLEAIEACKDSGAPRAVVVSQFLSGTDGVKLTQRIKEVSSTIPVILLGAVSSPGGLSDVRKASGADVVLASNCLPPEVTAALKRLLFPPPPKKRTGVLVPEIPVEEPEAEPAPEPEVHELELDDDDLELDAPPPVAARPPVDVSRDSAWILSRAMIDRVTGALRFASGEVERIVYLDGGHPTVVISNVAEERLGTVLVRKEKITEAELEEALNYSEKKQVRLLEVLVTMGLLSKEEKDVEVAGHYAERFLALFARSEWDVDFRAESAPKEDVTLEKRAPSLIVEGMRRHYELPRLQAVVDPARVLRAGARLAEDTPALELTASEAAVLRFVDGKRTVAEACTAADQSVEASPFEESLRTVYACLCLELVI